MNIKNAVPVRETSTGMPDRFDRIDNIFMNDASFGSYHQYSLLRVCQWIEPFLISCRF